MRTSIWIARLLQAATVIGAAVIAAIAVWDADEFGALAHKDSHVTTGLFEHLTVIVMAAGVICALVAMARYWKRIPGTRAALWLVAWTAAGIYFAGEECSWGQWYFGWQTPEALAAVNRQRETNIHNISVWLNANPRGAVEAFIILAGLLAPIALRTSARVRARLTGPMWDWVIPPGVCVPAATVITLGFLCRFVPGDAAGRLGNLELQELLIAWFLSLSLVSYLLRLRVPRVQGEATTAKWGEPASRYKPVAE